MIHIDKLGEIAYNAYCETRNWLSFSGDPLPKWQEVREDLRVGWRKAAEAVSNAVGK
jgi:hypothetical protein